jgi:outer membrane receptor for ferrienterochelin and colicins
MKIRLYPIVTVFFMFLYFPVFGQKSSVTGKISHQGKGVKDARISLSGVNQEAITDETGTYLFQDLESRTYTLTVTSEGFIPQTRKIEVQATDQILNIELQEDALSLHEVVVSGTRRQISRYDSPVIVSTVSSRTLEATQSLSISEGLSFTPGLRLENNCQNCGFTQLRMNGLDGAYSQILVNSRPIFSALAGVYGLEMLPANMVDRIEVVRGGGSVLYGGNAIAGTVNIITKDPSVNSYEIGLNQAFTNFENSDRSLTFNAALVSNDLRKGLTFFAFHRDRAPWDANQDNYSELTKINSTTFGFDAFHNTTKRGKFKFGLYLINEFRRGGNNFHLKPHETDLTEQLEHKIVNSNFSFERYSKDVKHKFSVYASSQIVDRASYYGSGGRLLEPGDSLSESDIRALNAYGNSADFSLVAGVQYNFDISKSFLFTCGIEQQYNAVNDQMPGYGRSIDQQVSTVGNYAQLEWKPTTRWTFLFGGRFDFVQIAGNYTLAAESMTDKKSLPVAVPRITTLYRLTENWKIRGSFAQGYRAPQAFNEDLHIETVGGAARFIRLAPDLKTERSNSGTLSLNYDRSHKKTQVNFLIEGFVTALKNPFILSDQAELSEGVSVITKRNGDGALVQGANIELNLAYLSKIILQSGGTLQTANYTNSELIWAPSDPADTSPATYTKRLLRTPNAYAYFSLVYTPSKKLSIAYSGIFTGRMIVPHVIDPETEQTVLKSTRRFFENNVKVAYAITLEDEHQLQFFAGLQNIFNSYQCDQDIGALRDAGYVYGPVRPRTVFVGLKFGMK